MIGALVVELANRYSVFWVLIPGLFVGRPLPYVKGVASEGFMGRRIFV